MLEPTTESSTQDPSTQINSQDSSQQTSQVSSQQTHVFTQRGVTRTVHLDYLLYSRSVMANLIKSSRPSSSLAKKDLLKKEWEKYTPVGTLRVWEADLSRYNLETFKLKVVATLGKDRTHFQKLLESLLSRGDVKWQVIISNSQRYGPKKYAFLATDQDFYEFVEAVYEALNSKVTIKLSMDNPQGKAKQIKHVSTLLLSVRD
jgi:hypothetical protein